MNKAILSFIFWFISISFSYAIAIDSAIITNEPCYGDSSGSISISVSGGVAPYAYQWSNGGPNSPTLTGLGAGTYIVIVTDTLGASAVASYSITEPTLLATSASVQNTCTTTGSIILEVSGGTPSYTYLWNNGGSGDVNNNLVQGIYFVSVTDSKGCVAAGEFIVSAVDTPAANAGAGDTICAGLNVTIGGNPTASGGSGIYTYSWNGGISTVSNPLVSPSSTTVYTVVVTDSSGCSASSSTIVAVNPEPLVNAGLGGTLTDCPGSSIILGGTPTASGGSGNYSYNWSPANSLSSASVSNPIASDLTQTVIYTITVSDNIYGCSASASTTLTVVASNLTANAGGAYTICAGSIVTIGGAPTASGGTGPYSYAWSGTGLNNAALSNPSSSPASNATYVVIVSDANACTASASVDVIVNPSPVTNLGTDSICNGATYNFNGRQLSTSGFYTDTLTTGLGCDSVVMITLFVKINVIPTISISGNDSVCSGSNSTFTANVTNGGDTPGYQWKVNGSDAGNNSSTFTSSSLTNGAVVNCVLTSDAVCVSPAVASSNNINVALLQNPLLSDSVTNATSSTSADGAIDLTVIGGTPPFRFSWGDSLTTPDILNLLPGAYPLTVTDADGCTTSDTFTVNVQGASNDLTLFADTVGSDNGKQAVVTVKVNNFNNIISAQGTLKFNPAVLSFVDVEQFGLSSLTLGNFGTTAVDSGILRLVWTNTLLAGANLANGSVFFAIRFNVTGTTGQSSAIAFIDTPVMEEYEEYLDTSFTALNAVLLPGLVNVNPPLSISGIPHSLLCNGDTSGAINLTINGGTPPYTYHWSNAATTQNLAGVAAGGFSVTVTDAVTATASATFTVLQPNPLLISDTAFNTCSGLSTGSIDLGVAGGTPGYTFRWSDTATTQNLNMLGAGTYLVTVTDANACKAFNSITINATTVPVPSLSSNSPVTEGDTIKLSASTIAGASYQWSGPDTFFSAQQNPVIPNANTATIGAYQVVVTVNGCSGNPATVNIEVLATVTGSIVYNGTGAEVRYVTLSSTGQSLSTTNTDTSNVYSFGLPIGSADTITPSKNNDIDKANGVTVNDVMRIQRYLLGTYSLATPYEIIAADANSSGSVTAIDLIYIRELILNEITTFPGNKLWNFVPSSYVFPNPQNPFPYPGSLIYSNLAPISNQNFIGMKLGSVNGSWNAAIRSLNNSSFESIVPVVNAQRDSLTFVPIVAINYNRIAGFQYTIRWDSTKLQFVDLDSSRGALNMQGDYFGSTTSGRLSIAWTDPNGTSTDLPANTALFYIGFKVMGAAGDSVPVYIDSSLTPIEVDDSDLNIINYTLGNGAVIISSDTATGIQEITASDISLSAAPNPFTGHTDLRFDMPNSQHVAIRVYDEVGQLVESREANYSAGKNLEEIGTQLSPGVYIVSFRAANYNGTIRIISLGN